MHPIEATHTVYLVEDDDITRDSLVKRITSNPVLQVSAAAATCEQIYAALTLAAPDVLLVDLGLPDGNGLNVIAYAARVSPRTAIMVITMFADEQRLVAALRAGATGYLLKDDAGQEIGAAIEHLLAGGSPISPSIARHLIGHFRDQRALGPAPDVYLAEREMQVLGLAAKGFTYAEIARLLGVTANTVGSYTKRIYEKLAVGSRAEALYEASRLGLLDERRDRLV